MNKFLVSAARFLTPHSLEADQSIGEFLASPEQLGFDFCHGLAVSAEFRFEWFEPNLFERLAIARPDRIVRASYRRQAEFLAGRLVAQYVLKQIARVDCDVPIGPHGMPIWPAGVHGSISHTRDAVYCAAALNNSRCIGIDCENIVSEAQADELAPIVLSPTERQHLKQTMLTPSESFTLLFSAKECFFKANYPHLHRIIDFLDVEMIAIDETRKTVSLALTPRVNDGSTPIQDVEYTFQTQKVITILR